jgi:hypothetical protein
MEREIIQEVINVGSIGLCNMMYRMPGTISFIVKATDYTTEAIISHLIAIHALNDWDWSSIRPIVFNTLLGKMYNIPHCGFKVCDETAVEIGNLMNKYFKYDTQRTG